MSDFYAQLRFTETRLTLTINVPVVYMARDLMILMRATSNSRAQIALALLVAMSGPKKVSISWPTLSKFQWSEICPHCVQAPYKKTGKMVILCTVFVRISVTFSTLHSFISVKKNFDEHVFLTQHAHKP
jgi:hypothetical protein